MIISNNCESYHNHNICLNNMILPYRAVLVRSNKLSASQEVKKIPVAQNWIQNCQCWTEGILICN